MPSKSRVLLLYDFFISNDLTIQGYIMNPEKSSLNGRFESTTKQSWYYIVNNTDLTSLKVTKRDLTTVSFSGDKLYNTINRLSDQLTSTISLEVVIKELTKNLYEGVTTQEIEKALLLATLAFLEQDPDYGVLAARTVLQMAYKEVFAVSTTETNFAHHYRKAFIDGIHAGVENDVFNKQLMTFDLEMLSHALKFERDHLLNYLGLQTLHERYFLKINKKRVEVPQTFWMRIAMGLALNEPHKNEKALEFYEVFSNLYYISSTPTLFHSGYTRAQLSSCYLTTVDDDLGHIFKCMGDNAQLSKWAGGIGNDWTNIRGTGSLIKSIHATSQGVVPFLKIANDVVVGITRSGIRRGGTCAYLETWHLDIEDFLDLRKNTGDERRRTHDMNTANWIPDLFMKRVLNDKDWTLFSPHEVPDLHDLYGKAFEQRYEEYEQKAREGKIELFHIIPAQKLWRKMLSRLFETGHPWITFKDPCNIRSPQDHAGVVHSSNLCTEITLNTSADETAVCNLGSINLARHINNGILDEDLLKKNVTTAIRMLDNVIDLNFYPTQEALNSNMRHRPIGLGAMGFQDALFKLDIPFESDDAITFADTLGEKILYYAVSGSSQLAHERGTYSSYKGSKWDRSIFPLDTLNLLEQERGVPVEVSRSSTLDWDLLKQKVSEHGMRNSNLLAIAPTATIANIAGCYPCIEPMYKNIYVKSNIAGEFTIINNYLIQDLKALGLWNNSIVEQLKYYDGNLSLIESIPAHLKRKYKTAFELDPLHMIKVTAARGKWIDQSQSHNVFMEGVSGQKLHDIYIGAWKSGLKTTYYLRTLGASQVEKATLDASKYGYTQKREYKSFSAEQQPENVPADPMQFSPGVACNLEPDCESCQ
jgi:ribonucleoside-diphosphate reductase alpha chain